MKRFLYTSAAVALVAAAGSAQTQPVPAAPTTAGPVVLSTGPVVEYAPAAPARRGLFGRLRGRNAPVASAPTYAAPTTAAPVIATPPPVTSTPMPSVAPPQAMPSAKPVGMAVPTAPYGIVLTSATPDGAVTTADAATAPAAAPATVIVENNYEVVPARRGLFGRLRNR